MRKLLVLLFILLSINALAENSGGVKKVYVFPIREQILPSTARLVDRCMKDAAEKNADYILIDLNTYGGLLEAADSIRTRLLASPVPVVAFINNQAASAGALIAIAADSIYMRPGASIGAATVVDQGGEKLPDKYQSFMRSMMRATAESHGTYFDEKSGKERWHRNPRIAEAMVDESIAIPGLVDSTKILTLTTNEAIEWGYCEGKASSVEEVAQIVAGDNAEIFEYRATWLDRLLGFLTNPAFQGLMIMLIVGGIYFELQTPGVGFPLIAACVGALLYFAPLYVEGLAQHWELALFIIGIVLVIVEIFVTPGFGVLGIAGIAAIVAGLVFAVIDSDMLRHIPTGEVSAMYVLRPLSLVIINVTVSLVLCLWLGRRFLRGHSALRERIVLTQEMDAGQGYVSRAVERGLVGTTATVAAVMRPTGKVTIDGVYYEAASEDGLFIDKGSEVIVVRDEGGVLYCRKK